MPPTFFDLIERSIRECLAMNTRLIRRKDAGRVKD
jgi:hypothetical protein